MKSAVLYISGLLIVAVLAPLTIEMDVNPYPLMFLLGTVPVVLFFTGIIVLPLYLALSVLARRGCRVVLPLSFVAGFVSMLLFKVALRGSFEQIGTVVYIRNNHLTFEGWKNLLLQSLAMGIASLPGGVLFWLAARAKIPSRGVT